jgi:kynurenine formamidase
MTTTIDLTMPIYEGMPGHPYHGRTPIFLSGTLNHWMYQFMERRNPYSNEKISFANEQIVLCGHTGTHMDAPSHAVSGAADSIDQLALERGYGPALRLDVTGRFGPRAEITAADLAAAEARSGDRIRPGDIVLIWTGWATHAFARTAEYLDQHMGLTRDAADWLRERRPATVGVDLSTPETIGGAHGSPVHTNFLRPQALGLPPSDYIAIIENLVNLDRIPTSRFTFVGAPLPFRGQTGSPIRAFAVV